MTIATPVAPETLILTEPTPVRAPAAARKRVLFVQTSMPVGGAETLLVNLVRRLDPERYAPEVVCLKERGPLGELLVSEGYTVHQHLLSGKHDLRVLPRLIWLMRQRGVEAVVTVGAGDKMFWGRLAARLARVPVVASALHSTGWPDGVGRLNRMLTPITDAFIAVAKPHGEFLVEHERFPASQVHVIPNGVDTERFVPDRESPGIRAELCVDAGIPLVGILAALRPEKNHELFLRVAKKVLQGLPDARFIVIGDGPRRGTLLKHAAALKISHAVHFLGNRDDIPAVLASLDALALTSHNEANPVSILEGMSCGLPVVATDVGSVSESVLHGETGYLVAPGDESALARRLSDLLADPNAAAVMGAAGRRHVVQNASLDVMVEGYERLIDEVYAAKVARP